MNADAVTKRPPATRQPRAVLERIFDEIVSHGDFSRADTLVHDDFVVARAGLSSLSRLTQPGGGDFLSTERASGRDNFLDVVTALRAAFPDLAAHVVDAVRDGDRLGARWQLRGTHDGAFMGVEPTGRVIEWTEVGILDFRDGRLARLWGLCDELTVAAALGFALVEAPNHSAPSPAHR